MSVIYNTLTKLKRPPLKDVSPGEFQLEHNPQFLEVSKTRRIGLGILGVVALMLLAGIGGYYGLKLVREERSPSSPADNVVITKSIAVQQKPQKRPAMHPSVDHSEKQMPQYLPPTNPAPLRQTAIDRQNGRKVEIKSAAQRKSPLPKGKDANVSVATKKHAVINPRANKIPASSTPAFRTGEDQTGQESRATVNARRLSAQRSLTLSRLVRDLQTAITIGDSKRTAELFEQLGALKGQHNSYVLKLKAYWHMQQGQDHMAMNLLKHVLEQHPNDLEAGINMAILEINTNRLSAADKRLAQLREIYPEDTRISEIMLRLK